LQQPYDAWTPQTLRRLRQRLLGWYRKYHRQLPWRETVDPYAIWVSEIMLQQTQVATVIGYYHRFLARFPDVYTLAAAEEQEVLALWSGLGYYRRARQMHAAAKVVVAEHGGQFPRSIEELHTLPGIGRYTAGAIASFAYDLSAPIVEANTARLFSRLMAIEEPLQERSSQQRLWQFATSLLPSRQGAGLINQAAMEVGSQVCAPKPACERCPLTEFCRAFNEGLQYTLPVIPKKRPTTSLTHVALFASRHGRLLLRENEPNEWWHGLWDLPRIHLDGYDAFNVVGEPSKRMAAQLESLPSPSGPSDTLPPIIEQAIVQGYRDRFSIQVEPQRRLLSIQHSVTRFRITLHCIAGRIAEPPGKRVLPKGWKYYPLDALPPLSSPAKRVVQKLLRSV
jgi:A/G-specific adenine glycosylase